MTISGPGDYLRPQYGGQGRRGTQLVMTTCTRCRFQVRPDHGAGGTGSAPIVWPQHSKADARDDLHCSEDSAKAVHVADEAAPVDRL